VLYINSFLFLQMIVESKLKSSMFEKSSYWDLYLSKHVSFSDKLMNLNYIHYFNEIPYTRWPFYLSFSLFTFVFYMLLSLTRYEWALSFGLCGLFLVAYYSFMWFQDIHIESGVFGKYNRKVRACLAYGFALFIVSEIALFSGFFWTYFDRFFHPSMWGGDSSLPAGFQKLPKGGMSLIATGLLVSSGLILNLAAYILRLGNWYIPLFLTTIGICFGLYFLEIQLYEYSQALDFNITDSVYGSIFYFLTGFHGMHVLVGWIFLFVSFYYLSHRLFYTRERHLSFSLAIFYWHFVDIVWLFLYFSVYVSNFSLSV